MSSLFSYFCHPIKMVVVAQLVRASDCDSEGRGFEPPRLPQKDKTATHCFCPLFFSGSLPFNIEYHLNTFLHFCNFKVPPFNNIYPGLLYCKK